MATVEQPTVPAIDALSSNVTNSLTPAQQNHDTPKIPADPAMKMTDIGPAKSGAATDTAAAGIPFYEKRRQDLKELIAKKRALEKRLAAEEDSIYQKETEYLETTPAGNIVVGFDNYTKGTGNAAAARRKTGLTETNRVFSRSSVSYNANNDAQTPASSNSTPGGSLAPTPMSTSFLGGGGGNKEVGSGAPTPTSATGKASGASKKKKAPGAAGKAAAAAAAAGEDSEDSREKKVRTNFGAARK